MSTPFKELVKQFVAEQGILPVDGNWDYNENLVFKKDGDEWRPAAPSEIIFALLEAQENLEKLAAFIEEHLGVIK